MKIKGKWVVFSVLRERIPHVHPGDQLPCVLVDRGGVSHTVEATVNPDQRHTPLEKVEGKGIRGTLTIEALSEFRSLKGCTLHVTVQHPEAG